MQSERQRRNETEREGEREGERERERERGRETKQKGDRKGEGEGRKCVMCMCVCTPLFFSSKDPYKRNMSKNETYLHQIDLTFVKSSALQVNSATDQEVVISSKYDPSYICIYSYVYTSIYN